MVAGSNTIAVERIDSAGLSAAYQVLETNCRGLSPGVASIEPDSDPSGQLLQHNLSGRYGVDCHVVTLEGLHERLGHAVALW